MYKMDLFLTYSSGIADVPLNPFRVKPKDDNFMYLIELLQLSNEFIYGFLFFLKNKSLEHSKCPYVINFTRLFMLLIMTMLMMLMMVKLFLYFNIGWSIV